MIPFSKFILPIIHCEFHRPDSITESTLHPELEDLFGGGSAPTTGPKEEPVFMKQPHTKIDKLFARNPEERNEIRERLGEQHTRLAEHYSKFTPEHKDLIRRYTITHYDDVGGAHFRSINHRIIRNDLHPSDPSRMQTMDGALHLHGAPSDLTVWSGLRKGDHINHILNNEKVRHQAYLSTSLDPDIAAGFTDNYPHSEFHEASHRHLLQIHIPKGHPGAYVEHFTKMPLEHEFIMPRETILKIDHSKRMMLTQHLAGGGTPYHFIIHVAHPVTE